MQQLWKKILLGLLVVFLLPLGITAGISGKENLIQTQTIDLENYLPILLCQQISWDYEDETLKAQAVLARSSLYLRVKNGEMSSSDWKNLMEEYKENKEQDSYKEAYEKMRKATEMTKGQVLVYEGTVCEGVFHKVSSGYTRGGTENLQDTSYRYLTSVKSESDISAKEYLHGHYFSEEALKLRIAEYYPDVVWTKDSVFSQIEILERDSQDYVTRVKLGEVEVSGEELRVNLELSSSNFTLQETDGKIRFLCKGLGHGMGMSQFGANELAKKGNTYLNILNYYFPQTSVQKIHLQI